MSSFTKVTPKFSTPHDTRNRHAITRISPAQGMCEDHRRSYLQRNGSRFSREQGQRRGCPARHCSQGSTYSTEAAPRYSVARPPFDALGASSNSSSRMAGSTMRSLNDTKQPEADVWTWIVIGLVFSAVTAALYGPFVWEHWVI